ncbi:hypothetical protein BX600DRAFT_467596 [Xylariales sp. PMI_506]|nr:hypothetical protein BX600DRAFT_467596 [Xylariales sp. PMI_506]
MGLGSGFRAIIVGGGPTGLVQAILLERAGIDFVLVEQRDSIVYKTGAGLFTWPQAARLFCQLGLLDQFTANSAEVGIITQLDARGKEVRDIHIFKNYPSDHGYPSRSFERSRLMQVLADAIPDHKKHIKTGKRLTNIEISAEGVTAHFHDGTSEHGSILIGADGVWSRTRELLSQMDGAADAGIEPMPYSVTHYGVFGRCESSSEIPQGLFFNQHVIGDDLAVQLFTAPDQTFFIAYHRIRKSGGSGVETKAVEEEPALRFSDAEADAFLKRYLDKPVYGDVKFGDLWNKRYAGGVTPLHQGLVKRWHWDRVVMVGDSVHKVTPNIGIGANIGWESATSLTNHLHALLLTDPNPDTPALTRAFEAYQNERYARMNILVQVGIRDLRLLIMDDWPSWLLWRYAVPLLMRLGLARRSTRQLVSASPKLDFIEFEERPALVPWTKSSQLASNGSSSEKGVALKSGGLLGPRGHWWVGIAALIAGLSALNWMRVAETA